MSFKTTRDILDQVRSVHRRLREYEESMRDEAGGERLRLLLDHLARHKAKVDRALDGYEETARNALLDRWFQFTPDVADSPNLRNVSFDPGMSEREVIRTALAYDEALRELFAELADGSSKPELRELYAALALTKEEEKKVAARLALEVEHGM